MAIGSTAPWTDHEKKVCSFVRRTISSLVMAPGAVVMPMDHLGVAAAGAWPGRTSGVGSTAPDAVAGAPLQHNRGTREGGGVSAALDTG